MDYSNKLNYKLKICNSTTLLNLYYTTKDQHLPVYKVEVNLRKVLIVMDFEVVIQRLKVPIYYRVLLIRIYYRA